MYIHTFILMKSGDLYPGNRTRDSVVLVGFSTTVT